ncbi:TPA: hypothetical protein ACN5PU_003902 [Enterobacter hormaechei]|nr:hypothetical protein [Enterobacter hormaechei]EKS6439999.1 hypothetical protein [Enterobacter hormaechei]EKS6449959.1 hypothetical protein [Enterobacter hormaechei]EKS6462015.1 hypothetical protein [Enterobacter hormaechei]EKS6467818.1 hypothetical protein [Enterobacter hormaechei]
MKIIDNSLLIDVALTEEVYEQVKLLLTGLDDISLKIESSVISAKIIDLPIAVSSVFFKNCIFVVSTVISNLKDGRFFKIENCKRDFFLGNVKIKGVNCRNLVIDQDEIENFAERLSPDIEKCIIEYFECTCEQPPVFDEVVFMKKVFINSNIKGEPCGLFFNSCNFFKNSQLNIDIKSPISIYMDKCGFLKLKSESDSDTGSAFLNFAEGTIIKKLDISESKIGRMNFELFSIAVENLIIKDSEVGGLDLSTIEKDDDKNNYIYNMSVIGSLLRKFSFRHRKIIHAVDFSNTKFSTPPQIQGSNIPEGSVFPNKEHFVSRKGLQDASCYRALRFIMESQRNREFEGMFFSLEQESLLNGEEKKFKFFSANYLYYLFSDYGTSYRTPLIFLLISMPVFTIIYALISSPVVSIFLPIDWGCVIKSLIITLKQTFLPFDVLRNNDFLTNKNTFSYMVFVLVGVLNSIVSVSLIALSGLALRWKFKRG